MIKFLDLHKLNKPFEAQFLSKTAAFLDKSWYILGDEVKQFEQSLTTYYCIYLLLEKNRCFHKNNSKLFNKYQYTVRKANRRFH